MVRSTYIHTVSTDMIGEICKTDLDTYGMVAAELDCATPSKCHETEYDMYL